LRFGRCACCRKLGCRSNQSRDSRHCQKRNRVRPLVLSRTNRDSAAVAPLVQWRVGTATVCVRTRKHGAASSIGSKPLQARLCSYRQQRCPLLVDASSITLAVLNINNTKAICLRGRVPSGRCRDLKVNLVCPLPPPFSGSRVIGSLPATLRPAPTVNIRHYQMFRGQSPCFTLTPNRSTRKRWKRVKCSAERLLKRQRLHSG